MHIVYCISINLRLAGILTYMLGAVVTYSGILKKWLSIGGECDTAGCASINWRHDE